MSVLSVFIEVVLPIVLIFFIGYVLQKWRKLDVRSVSAVTIYVFIPALVFQSFYETELGQEFWTIVLFAFLLLFALILLNKILKWIMKWDEEEESGMILSSAFMNAGNYGAPVVLFAFGQEAFVIAVVFLALQALIMNFFGVYYASRSSSGIRFALIAVMKMPATYAIIAAFIAQSLNIEITGSTAETIEFMADVALPLMMVGLGMQLANISFKEFETGKVVTGTTVRLVVSPLIAWALVSFMPLSSTVATTLIVLAAMPTAATTTMYALEFKAKPELVSSVTLVSTILSVVSISILLIILG
ncbi:AEC family transporter [Alkalibacillus haloalkaliphilus]|uniref:AEC family transporter n=1 Tax=Alkalibacillus haloalkaliphilus TaxID=94136 RepID=UPI002935F286|nr:AEC family transporter [Alkalibacillus haloalkaliphilus]MDV2582815.1 AEC family transporter [Alkalibacillus haloalkaliphilus]